MEARNRSLPQWFSRIESKQLTLPRFQRHEAWAPQQIESLLETVIAGLPAGAVLVLEVAGREPFASRSLVGAPEKGDHVAEQLLDGQQRLTALWRSLQDDYPDRSYFVSLNPEDDQIGSDGYGVVSYARWTKDDKLFPIWCDDPAQAIERRLVPLSILAPGNKAENLSKEWTRSAFGQDLEARMQANDRINDLRNRIAAFNLPFLWLGSDTDKDVALDVFIKMNTSATPLKPFDIVVAQVEASAGESLHELVEELDNAVPSLKAYQEPSTLILSTAALLQGEAPTKATFLSGGFAKRLFRDWDLISTGIRRCVSFLEEERIYDGKRLPSDISLYLQSALWACAPEGLDAEGKARRILRSALWRGFCTERYEKTSATRTIVDFKALRDFTDEGISAAPLFDIESYPLPSNGEILTAGWPVRKERLARVILALSLRSGGLDFADGTPAARDHLTHREYHHIFPKNWLESKGYAPYQINRALNCALVSWRTNRTISNKQPSDYIADRLEASSLNQSEVVTRIESHLLPVEAIRNNNYEEFLEERIRLIKVEMTRLIEI